MIALSVLKPSARVMQAMGVTQATGFSPAREHAQRVLQASTNLQQAMVIARTALRASTGLIQDKPRQHRARTVPRTRIRLLRAVRKPPALATQATVATPAQEHV